MRHWVDMEIVRLLQMRATALRASGTSGPEGSLGKLAVLLVGRRFAEWAVAVSGPGGMLLEEAPVGWVYAQMAKGGF